MTELLATAFIIGLAGSTHCLGMCGGIASSLLFSAQANVGRWALIMSYNFGRILSYTLAGYLVASLGEMIQKTSVISLYTLQILSAVLMCLLGLYISGWWTILRRFESLFTPIFGLIKPLSKRLLPLNNAAKAVPYGIIWGWLPCGLVYSSLTWTLRSETPVEGALFMLFFGLGTLPAIVAVALSSDALQRLLANPLSRKIMGTVIIIYSISLLYLMVIR
jgi:sulfite exporter TauE/SafE